MSVVELSDEENVVILAQTFTDSLADLDDRPRQVAVLKRIYELLDSSAPQHYIYETVQGCDELEVIRVGRDRRIFCRLVMGIPKGDKEYNVLFVFYVDTHNYRSAQLRTFDDAARQRLQEVTRLEDVGDVEAYLEELNTFRAEEIKERIDRMGE